MKNDLASEILEILKGIEESVPDPAVDEAFVDSIVAEIISAVKEFAADQGIEPSDEHFSDMWKSFKGESDEKSWHEAGVKLGVAWD